MKKKFIYLVKLIIAGIISICILSVFTLFYNYSGVHIKNFNGETDYKWEPNQYMSTMEEGFAWFRMDSNGFNNAIHRDERPDILLMGSSHFEAVQMQPEENVAYLLNEELPEYYTYNIGTSGHTIYTCMKNINNAINVYEPQKYILLETDKVDLDINNMKKVINNTYPTIPSYDSGIVYQIQKNIPSIKALYKSIDNWKETDNIKSKSNSEKQAQYTQEYEEILDAFLKKASESCESNNIKLIIVYHSGTSIDKNGTFKETTNQKALELFENSCKKNNIKFIDMTSAFKTLYENEKKLAHGFSNTSVGSGHLNKYGHKEIAKTIAAFIKVNEEGIYGTE